MQPRTRTLLLFAFAAALAALLLGASRGPDRGLTDTPGPEGTFEPEIAPSKTPAPKIQIALRLDTSSRTEGLIHKARTQLWKLDR